MALFLLLLTLALLAPSTASADWLPIEEVGVIPPSDQEIQMASNDRGDKILLWGAFQRGFQVSVSRRGGPFSEPRTVPGSGKGALAGVDLNEDGRAIVWWREIVPENRHRIRLVGLKVDGGFGKPRTMITGASGHYVTFEPVIGPGGRFAFVYTTSMQLRPVYARVAPPSGKLGPRTTVATGSIQSRQLYYLGNRPMIDYLQASDGYSRLRERQIGSGGPRVIATIPKNGSIVIDTASNGRQAALWTGRNTEGPKRELIAATRRPGGTFGKGNVLDNRIPPQEMAVAVARNGYGIVAWREWNESTTEDDPSPTPEYEPGNIVWSFMHPGLLFSGMRQLRPEEANTLIEDLSADVNSEGFAVLGFQATTFSGIQRRLYTARTYRGDSLNLTPMTDYDNLGFRPTTIELDERSQAAYGWVDERTVFARRADFDPFRSG